ncbi:hypothetical protein ACIRL2_27580 [Embleya sp. NPDC127516]|uniref:hypothetical protein n=1 Tax=Embleya sp. NPDC127516 TaxID=3363990 RepID=UPI003810E236
MRPTPQLARTRDDVPAHRPNSDLLLIRAVHDALRRDLHRLVIRSLMCPPVVSPGWNRFLRHLTTTLDADAAVLWPVLRKRQLPGPHHELVAAEMERRRRRITLLAATVDDCLTGRGPASRTAEYMADLDTALTGYLDYEQAVVLPLAANVITAGEWADLDAAQRHPLGVTSGVALCAWLIDDMPPDRQQAIRKLFPPAVRLAHRWVGDRHRRRTRLAGLRYASSDVPDGSML